MSAVFRAPQLGLPGMPALNDNPDAQRHAPCPAPIRQRLRELRDAAYAASFDPRRNDMLNLGARMRERAGRRALP